MSADAWARAADAAECPTCGVVHGTATDEVVCTLTASHAAPKVPPRAPGIAATPLARRCAALCESGFFTDDDDDGDRTPHRVTYACRVCGGTGLAPIPATI